MIKIKTLEFFIFFQTLWRGSAGRRKNIVSIFQKMGFRIGISKTLVNLVRESDSKDGTMKMIAAGSPPCRGMPADELAG